MPNPISIGQGAERLRLTVGAPYVGSAFSPTIEVEDIDGGHRVTTVHQTPDGLVPNSFDVMDGRNVSVSVTDAEGGHLVTFRGADGAGSYLVPSYAQEEADREYDESLRVAAESRRAASESDRNSAEAIRDMNEGVRLANEYAREEAERARARAEALRGSNEAVIQSNEGERYLNEEQRRLNELQRQADELARLSEERERVSAETERARAELSRESAESLRADAEASRGSAEAARDAAEASRRASEAAREAAEAQRAQESVDAVNAAHSASQDATRVVGEVGDMLSRGEFDAGFGTPTATVDQTIGTAAVEVTASGTNKAKEFHFAFSGIKGERGEKGDTGDPQAEGAIGARELADGAVTTPKLADGSVTADKLSDTLVKPLTAEEILALFGITGPVDPDDPTWGNVPIATTDVAGIVKPDGVTISVAGDGTISANGGGTVISRITNGELDGILV